MGSKPARASVSQLPTLTGMRWLAAFLVFLYHASCENLLLNANVSRSFAWVMSKAGLVGVSFFFVLSGFVLTWSARPGDSLASFWRRRFLKIYPNHLVTFAAALLLILWSGPLLPGGSKGSGAIANLLLVQNWIPDPYVFISVNGVSWSLSCEVLFYLTFPLWFKLVGLIRPARLWWWAGAVVVAIACVPLAAEFLPGRPLLPWKPVPAWPYWFVYVFPPVRMLEFILGILLARIVRNGQWINLSFRMAGLLFALGYAATLYVPELFGFVAATIVPVGLLIAAGAVADLRGLASPFRSRPAVWLGEVSFAFYLVHRLVLMYGHQAIGRERQWTVLGAVGLLLAALVVSVGCATLLYRLVEVPVMRAFAGRSRTPGTPRPLLRLTDAGAVAAQPRAGQPGSRI